MRGLSAASRPLVSFLGAQALTTFTSELLRVAIPIALYLQTKSSTTVAYATAVTLLPRVLFSAVAGAAVDRVGVKRSLIAADLIQGLGALLFLVTQMSGSPHALVYSILFLINSAATLKNAAIPAAVGDLTGPNRFTNVYGALWTFESLSATLAPLAAAFLVARGGLQGVAMFYATAAFVSIGLLIPLVLPRHNAPAGSLWSGVREGAVFLWRRGDLLKLALFSTLVNFTFTLSFVMFTPMILLASGDNAFGPARVFMWGGIAQLVSSAVLGVAREPKRPVRAMLLCTVLIALGPLVIGLSSSLTVWTVAFAATMALLPLGGSWERPVWLLLIDKQFRGRAFGLRRMIVAALLPLGSMLSAGAIHTGTVMKFSPLMSHRLLFVIAGTGLLMISAAGLMSRSFRALDARYAIVRAEAARAHVLVPAHATAGRWRRKFSRNSLQHEARGGRSRSGPRFASDDTQSRWLAKPSSNRQ